MEGLKVITVSKSTKTDWSFKSTAWSTAEKKVLTLNKLANSEIVEEEKAMKWYFIEWHLKKKYIFSKIFFYLVKISGKIQNLFNFIIFCIL